VPVRLVTLIKTKATVKEALDAYSA
jgi:hypothetical protein